MRFDGYGMPEITSEEGFGSVCLLPLLQARCDYRPKAEPKDAAEMMNRRSANEVGEAFHICTRCWIMQRLALGQKKDPPPDYCEVHCYTGGAPRESYAVSPTALRSLETLWEEQRTQKYSDSDYTHAFRNAPVYLVWESKKYIRTIALYPWKLLREIEEEARRKATQCPYLVGCKPDW